jgi:adenylate cyclase
MKSVTTDEIKQRIEDAVISAEAGRLDASIAILEETFQLAIDQGHDELLATICIDLGLVSLKRGDYRVSLVWLQRALALAEESSDLEYQAAILGNMGNVQLTLANYTEALDLFQRSYDVFTASGNTKDVGPLLLNIGIVHASRGDLASALEWYYRALEYFTERDNWRGIGHASGAIGDLFYDTAEYEQSLRWYQQALDLYEQHDHQAGVVLKYCQLGRVYGSLHDHVQERALLTKAVALAGAYSLQREHVVSRSMLATSMIKANQFDDAAELVEVALPQARSMGLRSEALDLMIASARIHLAQERRDKALTILTEALAEARELGIEKTAREAHQLLYEVERDHDPMLALQHLEQVVEIRNRHQSEQKQRRMALLEMEHKLSAERREYQAQVEQERRLREQQRELLTNMMPERIADSLMAGATMIADTYDDVSIMFIDMVNFTELASTISASEVVMLLNNIFNMCDDVMKRHGLTKIKTIGDAYLAVGGAPDPLEDHVERMANAALDVMDALQKTTLNVRIGIHCGTITAGVIGEYRKAYDVWGDSVNLAARMEQTGEKGRIHVTPDFAARCAAHASVAVIERGQVPIKGKGTMTTYWLARA